jgi:hypothetical protein
MRNIKTSSGSAPETVVRLCRNFTEHLDHYKSQSYNETELRREYLDPFFKALGWDIDNERGYADAYKDVIHEDAIKIGGYTKAPDYCFRIGGARKFFLEAKKPAVDIRDGTDPAYQLRRYAWSAKLPLSILSDFEELSVYDCRVCPKPRDKASTARTLLFHYTEYADRWHELADVFSREAVLRGSFDKYAEKTRTKRGTAEVDDAFLQEIERWREALARNFALRNAALSVRDLNYAVQKTIDRIIFLRICEDRGTEDYRRLRTLVNGANAYRRMIELFRRADERYNSGLFHFEDEKNRGGTPDTLTPELNLDEKVLQDIIRNLYYPESPYEFSVLPADILGQVYERFLGKTIRLTAGHQAKIEEKPEVRKAGGVYYTPKYIVDYIVKNTLGRLLNGPDLEKPQPISLAQAEKIKLVDPACGSGSFLIVAYQYLLDWHRDRYTLHPDTRASDPARIRRYSGGKRPKIYQAPGGEWKLTTSERKRILLANIHGVDIDSQAVEVTKLSLLLKVLEGETQQRLQRDFLAERQRILPDLGRNIQCGNSLIGPDFYEQEQMLLLDDETRYRINVFDWQTAFPAVFKQGGFDCVIGNPPYRRVNKDDNAAYFENHYEVCEGRIDLFELFIEKASQTTKIGGWFSLIVPAPLLTNQFSRKARTVLWRENVLESVVSFSFPVFADPTVHTCIFVAKRLSPQDASGNTRIYAGINAPEDIYLAPSFSVPYEQLTYGDNEVINVFITPPIRRLLGRLKATTLQLGELCYMRQCIKTGDDSSYLMESSTSPGHLWKPALQGRGMNRYLICANNLWVKYGSWLARNWQNTDFYERPKIGIRETGARLTATLDIEHRYFLSSLYSVYFKNKDQKESLKYLLGIINSNFASWLASIFALSATKGAFTKFRTNQLAPLPIRPIDFDNPADVALHDKMVQLVERMLDLNRKNAEERNPETLRRLETDIALTDRQIDRLVYELYNLTPAEIAIVEGEKKQNR